MSKLILTLAALICIFSYRETTANTLKKHSNQLDSTTNMMFGGSIGLGFWLFS